MIRNLLIGALLGTLLLAASVAEARRLSGEASGWGTDAGSTAVGRDNLGKFTVGGVSELEEFDESNPVFCDFDEFGYPRGVELQYVSLSQVVRYKNGDLMFSELDPNVPSTLCFNFIDNVSSTFEAYSIITGGTGRFEGATGYSAATGSSTQLGDVNDGGIFGFSSKTEGEIFLQHGHHYDEDDDD